MRIAVVYHVFPHYRQGVLKELDKSTCHDYSFIASSSSFEGIESISPGTVKRFVEAPFVILFKKLFFQIGAIQVAFSNKYDVIVFLANPNFISTWVAAALARLSGKKVLFWTHGWLKKELLVKKTIRNLFYSLANKLLVYSDRSKAIGIESGFSPKRISVIYNSLDLYNRDLFLEKVCNGFSDSDKPQSLFENPDLPLIICTARLTKLCRFDLLFEAADKLLKQGVRVNILLIGDGPERASLEAKAISVGVEIIFYGACYDEFTIGPYLYFSDLSVSPGKIGLTAMHSLMYGTPAITHSNLDHQMPEVEAIEEGVTGDFFAEGDSVDLAFKIKYWFDRGRERGEVRNACFDVIEKKWNPYIQKLNIEDAINSL